MNALQAFKKVQKAAAFFKYGWIVKYTLVSATFCILVYCIWWQWQFDTLGLVTLGFGMWFVTAVALPFLYSRFNVLYARMAMSSVNRLIELGTIDDNTIERLKNTNFERWPDVISSSISNGELRDKTIH